MLTNNTQDDLIKGVLYHGPKILEKSLADPNTIIKYLERIAEEHLDYPIPKGWTGTTPEKKLDEVCRRHNLSKPKYTKLPA